MSIESPEVSRGRPPSTTPELIAQVAMQLFAERGFEETTMGDIAAALGVGRRTMFRYFPSKNDIVWGDFDSVLARLRNDLAAQGDEVELIDAVATAAVSSNRYPPDQQPGLRLRMKLITTVPALQAHSMLRYADWRGVIAEYAAVRRDEEVGDLFPQTLGFAALGASMAAFSVWVRDGGDLEQLLERSYLSLSAGFRSE